MTMSPTTTAQPTGMPFGVCTFAPKEPCIRWKPGFPMGMGHFGGHSYADLPAVDILDLILSPMGSSDEASGYQSAATAC